MRIWLVYRAIPIALAAAGVALLDVRLNVIRPILLDSIAILKEYVRITVELFF